MQTQAPGQNRLISVQPSLGRSQDILSWECIQVATGDKYEQMVV